MFITENNRSRHLIVAMILLVFCFMLYGGSLQNGFMIDDYPMILGLAPMDHWQALLTPSRIKDFLDPGAQFIFRPVSSVTRLVLFHFFGDHPFYYHLFNISIFSAYCFLVYILLHLLTGSLSLSLYGCLLFCVHPINTMPVDYLSGHEIILFGILGILSLIAFLRYTETKSKIALGLSLFGYILSVLTQEIMIILPAYMVVILIFIKKCRWREILRVVLPYFFVALLYVIFRLTLTLPKFNPILCQMSSHAMNPLMYLGVLSELVLWYISRLFVPDHIVFIWAVDSISLAAAIRNIFILGALSVCFVFLIRRWRRNLNSFALTWFLLGFAPVTVLCLIYPDMGFVIEPHWFFLSSLGFFILGANLLKWIGRVTNRKIAGVIFLGMMAVLFLKTQGYHPIWKDEKTYCRYWVDLSPKNPGPNFWLAHAYWGEGNYEKAQYFFARAIVGEFRDWEVYASLGSIAFQKGNLSLAKNYFARSLAINPQAALVYNNLGTVHLRENDLQKAEEYFEKSFQMDPYSIEPRLNLADIAKRSGHRDKAMRFYEENLRIDPWDQASLYFLIEYHLENDLPKAEQLGRRLLKSRRNIKVSTLTDLGSLFAGRNQIRLASLFYERALKADPSYKEIYLESGKLHGNLEHWSEAISTWETGRKLDPSDSRFSELIQEAQRLQSQGAR